MALTYKGANALLECLTGRVSTYPHTTVYVGLSTTAPNVSGGNVSEPTGNGYARVLLSKASGADSEKHMNAAANGSAANKDVIYFPEATGAWGTCTHFTLWTAQTGGNLIGYGQLTTAISPVNETVPIIRVGDLVMGIS